MKTKTLIALFLFSFVLSNAQEQANALSNRGMYVAQAFDRIISKPQEWVNFFQYCRNNKFTYLCLYGVSGAGTDYPLNTQDNVVDRVNADKAIILSDFIQMSKLYGIEEIGVGVGSVKKTDATVQYDERGYVNQAVIISTGVVEYNRISTYPGKINLLTLEAEWWNAIDPTNIWNNVIVPIVQSMGDARNEFPENFLRTEVYMGDFTSDNISDPVQVAFLEQNVDRLILSHYTRYLTDFMRPSYTSRMQTIGMYATKKMELWPMFQSSYGPVGTDAQGYIMMNEPNYNTIDKIEKHMRAEYNSKVSAGFFSTSQNIKIGGYMWFAHGKQLEEFSANSLPNSVSLGRHILKNYKDCPINVHANTTGTAPFTFQWKFPDGSTLTTSNSLKPFDDQLVKGWGRVEVTVFDAMGQVSSDYVYIYSDADIETECDQFTNLVSKDPNTFTGSVEIDNEILQSLEDNLLTIGSNNDTSYKISVINYSGQLLTKPETYLNSGEIIQFQLESGFYILIIEDKEGNVKRRTLVL